MVLSPGKGTGLDPPRARSRPSHRESDQVSPGPPVAVKQSGTAKLLPDLPTGKQDALPIIRGRPVAAPALPVSPPSRRPRVRTACTRCKLQPLSISENARPEHSRPPAPRALRPLATTTARERQTQTTAGICINEASRADDGRTARAGGDSVWAWPLGPRPGRPLLWARLQPRRLLSVPMSPSAEPSDLLGARATTPTRPQIPHSRLTCAPSAPSHVRCIHRARTLPVGPGLCPCLLHPTVDAQCNASPSTRHEQVNITNLHSRLNLYFEPEECLEVGAEHASRGVHPQQHTGRRTNVGRPRSLLTNSRFAPPRPGRPCVRPRNLAFQACVFLQGQPPAKPRTPACPSSRSRLVMRFVPCGVTARLRARLGTVHACPMVRA